MVSLSNTRSGGERTESPRGGHNEDNQGAPRIVVEREPDEHTRLLPQPSTRDGYLSPDDPAVSFGTQCFNITLLTLSPKVSPYNLWSVRFMRYFSILLLV